LVFSVSTALMIPCATTFLDEFVNVLMFKLLDQLPHAIKGSSQRVSFVIADFLNQGVEAVHKFMVVSNCLRDGQSQLLENTASYSWVHYSLCVKTWRM
jgi:hypothetical protein